MSGVIRLSVLTILLGAKGFTHAGLPFSAKTRLTGTRGRAVGAACMALGLAGIAFAYWASDQAGRQRLGIFGQGVLVGLIGAFLLFGWGNQGTLPKGRAD